MNFTPHAQFPVVVDTIEEILVPQVPAGRNLTINMSTGGSILIKDPSGNTVASIDSLGNITSPNITLLTALAQSGIRQGGVLAIDDNAIKFQTTDTLYYVINGIQYSKEATTAIVFDDNDAINTDEYEGSFWGAWLVQINAAGTFSTKPATSDQHYTSKEEALAELPAADEGNVIIGYIVINANDDSAWTANTDDMTDASDCVTAEFIDATVPTPIS